MIKITKFMGRRFSDYQIKNYQGYVIVEKDGVTREMTLPVRASSAASASSEARRWRNVEGNMQRLEKAFDEGLSDVPSNKVKTNRS